MSQRIAVPALLVLLGTGGAAQAYTIQSYLSATASDDAAAMARPDDCLSGSRPRC